MESYFALADAEDVSISRSEVTRADNKGVKKGLDTIQGVFLPCVLSIIGAIFFLRLSWSVGELGWLGSILTFTLGHVVIVPTVLSLAAISTNGSMKGGGVYYMVSRSLGPEIGASIGVVYAVALSISVSFFSQAFSESFLDSFLCDEEPCSEFHNKNRWLSFGIATVCLFLLLLSSLLGATALAKLNTVFFGAMMISILLGAISLLIGNGPASFSLNKFWKNTLYDFSSEDSYRSAQNLLSVFAVIFPGLTGIMAGANYSGDLADPGRSIGLGTLLAVGFTFSVYCTMILIFGATLDRDTLKVNQLILQDACVFPSAIMMGVMLSTLSSALGSLVGAARILQALARDRLLKPLNPFAQGSAREDEPQVALLLCWLIAQICLFIGELDAIASVITDCFLLVYFSLNLACFALTVSGAPNFRPRFVYFSWKTALLGAVVSVSVMFLTSPVKALVAVTLTAFFSWYVHFKAPLTAWGDVTQAIVFHQVRKYLLRIDIRKDHPKFWRPSILLLLESNRNQMELISFCNSLKKGGLFVVGNVLVEQPGQKLSNLSLQCMRLRYMWLALLEKEKIKCFGEVTVSSSLREGYRSLIVSCGIGGMRPNTVVLQFLEKGSMTLDWAAERDMENSQHDVELENDYNTLNQGEGGSYAKEMLGAIDDTVRNHRYQHSFEKKAEDFFGTLNDAISFEKNVLVARKFEQLNKEHIAGRAEKPTVDIWTVDEGDWNNARGTLALEMQLAFSLHRTDFWEDKTKLRVVAACKSVPSLETENGRYLAQRSRERLSNLLADIRVEAEVLVLPSVGAALLEQAESGYSLTQLEHCAELNAMVAKHSSDSCVVFLPLPTPDIDEVPPLEYVKNLELLTQGIPPCVLTLAGERQEIITTAI